ncbi:MAG TPA: glucarate dehydratase family protein [Jatrophihabitans sp.]|jgi:glucarate dehydratase
MQITDIRITPVAVKDPPLLNSVGVHQPYALRAVLEVETDSGLTGLGESYGDDVNLGRLWAVADTLIGLDPFDTNRLVQLVTAALGSPTSDTPHELVGRPSAAKVVATTLAAFEVPLVDLQAQATGRRVCDLLGGAVREAVPYSGYLFYRWARHVEDPGYQPDDWGEALDPDGIVAQARRLVAEYGFGSLKLKGGVFPPDQEIDAILALRDAFGEHALRIDPNGAWTVATSIEVGQRLSGVLEYLEDPTDGFEGMAEVARSVPMPLATNMCVTTFQELPPALAQGSIAIVLSDHHLWGGLRESQLLAGLCRTFDLGLSMHSNTHLGISLAAMTHLAAATPNLSYACDTHTPWQVEDVISPGSLTFAEGNLAVPTGPGLGVELDRDALARLHQQYLDCGIRHRDDVGQMRAIDPSWSGTRPRF